MGVLVVLILICVVTAIVANARKKGPSKAVTRPAYKPPPPRPKPQPKPPPLTCELLNRQQPPAIGQPGQRRTQRGARKDGSYEFIGITTDLNAYCLYSGKPARECSCPSCRKKRNG